MSHTSFVQFKRCRICNVNHNKLQHIYSDMHKKNISTLLEKYSKKVSAARAMLTCPVVEEHGAHADVTFWCYFCGVECDQHKRLGLVTLVNAALLDHLASDDHWTQTVVFWNENRIPKAKRQQFLLLQHELNSYYTAANEAAKKVSDIQRQKQLKVAYQIRAEHAESERLVQFHQVTKGAAQSPAESHHRVATFRTSRSDNNSCQGTWTVGARGDGLTCLKLKSSADNHGNIFSGAVPPWLQGDERNAGPQPGATMGPSIDDYNKHLENERKRKLPANRVGRQFDRRVETDSNWLPSFGAVWSKSRRSHTRGSSKRKSANSALCDAQVRQVVCKPYQRSESATSSSSIQSRQTSRDQCVNRGSEQADNGTRLNYELNPSSLDGESYAGLHDRVHGYYHQGGHNEWGNGNVTTHSGNQSAWQQSMPTAYSTHHSSAYPNNYQVRAYYNRVGDNGGNLRASTARNTPTAVTSTNTCNKRIKIAIDL